MNAWYKDAFFYHFYTLGVCNAPFKNENAPVEYRLNTINQWLPHLHQLHCNAVLFSPIFESISHGYDTTDYYQIDSRIGDNESFKHLVNNLHKEGFRVVIDGVFNHCGRDFFAFKDLLSHGKNSKYCHWFSGVDFQKSSPLGDPFTYDTWGGYYELPKFNLDNDDVVHYLLEAVQFWIECFDIDGLRLDAADCLTPHFMEALREKTRRLKKDFWLMGEVVHGDYRNWVRPNQLHSVTNYEIFKGLFSSHNEQNLFEISHSLNREFDTELGMYSSFWLYNFVDNHDQNRLASLVDKTQYLYTIYILLFTIPGIPSLYYGSEWGLKGQKGPDSDHDIRPYIDIENVHIEEADLEKTIKKLSYIRKEMPELRLGTYKELYIEYHKPFIFERQYGEEKVIIIINAGSSEHTLNLKAHVNRPAYDVLNDESIHPSQLNHLKIDPHWGRIIKC